MKNLNVADLFCMLKTHAQRVEDSTDQTECAFTYGASNYSIRYI